MLRKTARSGFSAKREESGMRINVLKAYDVHPYPDQYDCGCVLVYANNRDEARMYVAKKGPFDEPFTGLRAVRAPAFDKYSAGDKTYSVETNDGLPEPFYRDDLFDFELENAI
jgi:hypothetical protein